TSSVCLYKCDLSVFEKTPFCCDVQFKLAFLCIGKQVRCAVQKFKSGTRDPFRCPDIRFIRQQKIQLSLHALSIRWCIFQTFFLRFDHCFDLLERSEWDIFDPAVYLSVHVQFHMFTELCRRQPEFPELCDLRIVECGRNQQQFFHLTLLCNMRPKYTAHGKTDDIDPVHPFLQLGKGIPCDLQ